MKPLIPILTSILLTSCTVDCPDVCLNTAISNGSTTFELPDPQEEGLKYYVSIQSETQGIISQQFPGRALEAH
jgi:hypothetical protein